MQALNLWISEHQKLATQPMTSALQQAHMLQQALNNQLCGIGGHRITLITGLTDMTKALKHAIQAVAHKHELLVILVTDPLEAKLNWSGSLHVSDGRQAQQVQINAARQAQHQQSFQTQRKAWQAACELNGVHPIFLSTEPDFLAPLFRAFERRSS